MELKITGTPKEIADLVLGIQNQQVKNVNELISASKAIFTKFVEDFGLEDESIKIKLDAME